jgi:hypothetical protein
VHLITGVTSALTWGIYGEIVGWEFAAIYLRTIIPFFLTSDIISCFCSYTVLSIGTKDLKVGPVIKFGSR